MHLHIDSQHASVPRLSRASEIGDARSIGAIMLLVACGGFAMWWEIAGRGPVMWVAYPVGFALALFFGLIGLHAAAEAWRGGAGRVLRSILLLGADYAAIDATNILVRWLERPLEGAAGLAVVHIALVAMLFGLRGWNLVFLAAVTFLIKVVGLAMIPETVYPFFTGGSA